ncbi:RNA polymerase sigma-70 factor, ECF subfamily [Micromonospora echinaurantiaca]|uniref:RNA polymerase sigma-70 factor, ECF subfamily n=1 Tax=Micromonospora echinaurantiaca TaxID=47857 RepID=A0A1C5IG88_9ACTN|nr:sigma-70 family RNA polymerase sigma factor [Micromonospora echinaurantiaca]SCG57442.1 RNA polymerase sigma-70 factor, ECF subfamily [Micromonospora echinaurantiaca]
MPAVEKRFTALYERYYDDVERYVRRRAADIAVRDVVAEVFLVAWRRFGEVPSEPLPWLYGVARRVLANEIRGLQRGRRLVEWVAANAVGVVGDHADEVIGRVTVAVAFERLPESDREVLRLVAWEGLGMRDAAAAAGCSMAAFAMRLHRARRRLHRELSSVAPSPDTAAGWLRPVVVEEGNG